MNHSKEHLKKIALDFLYADGGGEGNQGTFKADQVLMILQSITGWSHEQIRYEIRKLANEN